MAGIAGIFKSNQKELVQSMLETISHRGEYGKEIIETETATVGMIWSENENDEAQDLIERNVFRAGPGFGHQITVSLENNNIEIKRGHVGVVPLYLAINESNEVCFASEVKALLPITKSVAEFLPGQIISHNEIKTYFEFEKGEPLSGSPQEIAMELKELLRKTMRKRIISDDVGVWLSGGLDSSAIAALARPYAKTLHTFTGGLKGASDFKYAKQAADFLKAKHHEVIIDTDIMLKFLPDVIYHLESFDALLVRSSIINLCVAWSTSNYVSDVFTGEGGDELFAGYTYLKNLPLAELDNELIAITKRLHNTALQRVDRTASAFGLTAHVVFVDSDVVDFAMRIPAKYKIKDGVEKWILRQAMTGLLPESILGRPKAKFWEGAGVESLLADYANEHITDYDFSNERNLKNGWKLNTKEELFYYRIFKEHFGELENLDWMGRSKRSPKDN